MLRKANAFELVKHWSHTSSEIQQKVHKNLRPLLRLGRYVLSGLSGILYAIMVSPRLRRQIGPGKLGQEISPQRRVDHYPHDHPPNL